MRKITSLLMLLCVFVGTACGEELVPISHSCWTVTALNEAGTSNNEGGVAFIKDDLPATFYHSNWSSTYEGRTPKKGSDGVQAFMIEMPVEFTDIKKVTYVGRTDGTNSGWATKVRVYVFQSLPEAWPKDGTNPKALSVLTYDEKEELLGRPADGATKIPLGTPAFDNYDAAWPSNTNGTRTAEFATPQAGRYVLFVMDDGIVNNNQKWLTCSDFQIYFTAPMNNNKVYYLKSGRTVGENSDKYLLYDGDSHANYLASTYSDYGSTLGLSGNEAKFQFAIYNYEGKYYFYNVAGGNFIGNNTANNGAIPMVSIPTNDVEIRLGGTVEGYKTLLSTNRTGALNVANIAGCHGVVNWTAGYTGQNGDQGNCFQIIEAADMPDGMAATIEAQIQKSLDIAAIRTAISATSEIRVGMYKTSAVAAVSAALATYDAAGGQTNENYDAVKSAYDELVANADARVTLSAGEKFVLKCIEDARGYLVYSTVANKGSETEPWVAGTNYSSQPSSVDADGVYKEWTYVTVNGSNYLFNVQKKMSVLTGSGEILSFANRGTAFVLVSGLDGVSNIQMGGSYLASAASWNGNHPVRKTGLDNGAKFYIEKVDASISEALKSKLEARAACSTFEEWKTAQLAVLGYVGGYAKSTQSAMEALTDFAGADEFIDNNSKVALTEGYYFLRSKSNQNRTNAYLLYTKDSEGTYRSYAEALGTGKSPAINNVWKLVACDTESENPGYKFNACNPDKYMVLDEVHDNSTPSSPVNSDLKNGHKFTFEDKGLAEFSIKNGVGKVMRTETDGRVNYWNNTDIKAIGSTWYIIPAEELNVAVDEYATIHLPFGVSLSEGFEAYGVTNVGTTYATMSEAKAEIPANTGAILKGNGQCTLTINDAAAAWDNNDLEGTNVVTYLPKQAYILSGDGENIGFYRALLNMDENGQVVGEETGTCFKNGANKAYLPVPAGENPGRFLNFDFGGTETGIEGIDSAKENAAAVVYDLSGRRVKNAQKGIYIVNGKKVIK